MILDFDFLKDVEKKTLNNYDCYKVKDDKENVLISIETAIIMCEDMLYKIEALEEENKKLENQIYNDYDPEIEIPEIHGKGITW